MKTFLEFKRTGPDGVKIFSKMFEARQVSHIKHLQTKSYAEHMALGSYYESLLSFIDSFIETYQGQYGIIKGYESIVSEADQDAVKYITNFSNDLRKFHEELEGDTHLQNIVDEIIALNYNTIYKLSNLS